MEPSKKDWKLYREKIVGWQETYMERLIKEYVDYLNSFSLCAKWDEITDAYNLDKAGLDKTCLTILINQRWMMR